MFSHHLHCTCLHVEMTLCTYYAYKTCTLLIQRYVCTNAINSAHVMYIKAQHNGLNPKFTMSSYIIQDEEFVTCYHLMYAYKSMHVPAVIAPCLRCTSEGCPVTNVGTCVDSSYFIQVKMQIRMLPPSVLLSAKIDIVYTLTQLQRCQDLFKSAISQVL